MKIIIAKTAGFCMGVRRAVELVLDASNKHKGPICTYGSLIHNPQVLDLLEERGISVIHEIPDQGSGTVLIRAHGVPPKTKNKLKKAGFTVIDATCPRVVKVQTIIRQHDRQGYVSIIVGDKEHPEVIALLGYTGGKGHVVGSLTELDDLPAFEKAIIVAQTTQNTHFFAEIKKWASRKFPHYKVFDTICDSTEKHQAEVSHLADSVDAVIVVGGRTSANTQRLAEIARQSGKPVYQIETESELDMQALATARSIGITAGASTPNWVIKRVYRALETLLSKKKKWRSIFYPLQRVLLLTNIYVSLGAGSLCYASARLQGTRLYFQQLLIAMLYVLSMHILNNLTGRKADRYNDPDRAAFYKVHQILLAFFAIGAGGVGLITAYTMGMVPFLTLLGMSALGLSYNLRLVPRVFSHGKYQRIRDIPGSKTFLIAMAWGIVTSVFPTLSVRNEIHLSTVLVFLWASALVFVRTAFFDLLDMQGDRIVGKETIPILLGEERTMRLLKSLLVISLVLLVSSSAFQILSTLGFFLAICPILIFLVLHTHERGRLQAGVKLEFLVETHFISAGIIALIWSIA